VNTIEKPVCVAKFALPNGKYTPAEFDQRPGVVAVPLPGPLELGLPVGEVRFGQPCDGTVGLRMPVPEAAVHEHYCSMPRENEVWCSGEVTTVKAEAIAEPVRHGADRQLGLHST